MVGPAAEPLLRIFQGTPTPSHEDPGPMFITSGSSDPLRDPIDSRVSLARRMNASGGLVATPGRPRLLDDDAAGPTLQPAAASVLGYPSPAP